MNRLKTPGIPVSPKMNKNLSIKQLQSQYPHVLFLDEIWIVVNVIEGVDTTVELDGVKNYGQALSNSCKHYVLLFFLKGNTKKNLRKVTRKEIPLVIFDNGLKNESHMKFKGLRHGISEMIYRQLKLREKLGELLLLDIDEYKTSKKTKRHLRCGCSALTGEGLIVPTATCSGKYMIVP
ncbi:MAG: hypothetical protein EXX96DRAFT_540770 [Benjaminiella poitrasii]|nr:MAG: hypothetical protein EXX96DRAFT_540770 [Benjaminiella poitrasii]